MTDMLWDRELALLADLAGVLRKYDRHTIDSLVRDLGDPRFISQVRDLLMATSAVTSPQTEVKKRQTDAPDRLTRTVAKAERAGGYKKSTIAPLIETVLTDSSFPTVREIRAFAESNGLPTPNARSRRDALAHVLGVMLDQPDDVFAKLLPEFQTSLITGERSLEGWNRIIARSRAELHPRASHRPIDAPHADTGDDANT